MTNHRKTKFKIGQLVAAKDNYKAREFRNIVGKIVKIEDNDLLLVDFGREIKDYGGNYVRTHNGGILPEFTGWWFDTNELTLVVGRQLTFTDKEYEELLI